MSERQTVILIVSPTSATRKPAWAKAEKAIKAWTAKELDKHAGVYFEEYYQKRDRGDDDDSESDGDESGGEFDGEDMMEKVEPTAEDARKALLEDLRTLKKWWGAKRLPDNMRRFWIAGAPVLMAEVESEDDHGEEWSTFNRLEWPLNKLYKILGLVIDGI